MDAGVVTIIQTMASTSLSFVTSVISNLWGLLLSLGILMGIGGFIYRRVTRIGS